MAHYGSYLLSVVSGGMLPSAQEACSNRSFFLGIDGPHHIVNSAVAFVVDAHDQGAKHAGNVRLVDSRIPFVANPGNNLSLRFSGVTNNVILRIKAMVPSSLRL